ncbi:hypothetical protein [Pediococcus pentosaceus]|uniref:hypothetical protein n=1 Tax=Pediococcus pentosaceus TaxID=1255 RepID=UPI001E4BD670|nr:hypothetical protein [Pediococcus pentosaceus]MCG7196753.1 hypothetical protein [Pediococcus pentosaceus]MCI2396425.1 hypothetical protein [Pediococcus pentosaceus]
MKLVNFNNQTYINIERIDEIVPWDEDITRIFIGGSELYHDINLPIKKVLDAISGSEEHLVNDANMNILKAESINSGHLNQQKYPFR